MNKQQAIELADKHFRSQKGEYLEIGKVIEKEDRYIIVAQFLHIRKIKSKNIKIRTIRVVEINKSSGKII